MNKEQKAAAVQEIAERLGEADAIFAVDYRGISVPEAAELRARLREADATFQVVKNRLAKRAAEQAGTTELQDLLDGPIALAFVKGDAVVAAKAIATFGRQHDILEYRGGLMDGEALAPDQFQAIARLPALEVLHGQLVGVTASPLTGLTRGLAAMLSGLAVGLGQIAEKGLVSGEAPAAEEPATEEETPAEEPQAEADPAAPGREAEEADGSDSETSEENETEDTPDESEAEGSDSEGSDSEEEK
jgi:large subunit ribosomal protein L10